MRRKIGYTMQAAGGLLLFLLACASDRGAASVAGLLAGLACTALLFAAGRALARRRRPAARRRMTAVIPITTGREYAPSGIR